MTQVSLEPTQDLAPYISYDDFTMTVFFHGSESSWYLAGKLTTIKIKLTRPSGMQETYIQVVLFNEASKTGDSVD